MIKYKQLQQDIIQLKDNQGNMQTNQDGIDNVLV